MKITISIAVAVLLALGVWLSLTLGNTAPVPIDSAPGVATSTPATPATPATPGAPDLSQGFGNYDFALHYPKGYTVDEKYKYEALGPGQSIPGVKFTIPSSMTTGTNLSTDTYLSVETILNASRCNAGQFLDLGGATAHNIASHGITYSFASSTGAGAGNRYEESVYAWPIKRGCIAVRYFVHYGVLENYPAGSVKAFDRVALMAQFDAIRTSISINH